MLYGTVLASGIAAFGLLAISGAVSARPLAPVEASSATAESMVELARYKRHNQSRSHAQPRGFRLGGGGAKPVQVCSGWKCTWPTSGGGCLVWEKSCKDIKIIDPFN